MGEETDRRNIERTPLVDLLANIKVAVAQLRLYPPQSPQVLKVATAAYQSINSYLNETGSLSLSRTPRGLLLNGKRLPASGEVGNALEMSTLSLLQEVQVKTISFRKGLSMDELITFLHALTKKFWDVKDGKEINRRFREQRVFQITVDEVEYVAVGAGDLVIEDATAKLEAANSRVAEIMRTIDQVIDAATQEGVGEQIRLQIMKKLLTDDPTLIQKAQAMGLGTGVGMGDAPGWITFEQARQSLGELMQLMRETEGPKREALRRLGHTLIGAFRNDPVIVALIKKVLADEATELMPSWLQEGALKEAAESTAVKRANSILTLEEEDQIKALAGEAATIIKELATLKRSEIIEELVTALTGFSRHPIFERRLAAVETLVTLLPTLTLEGQEKSLEHVEQRVRSAINMERDARVYPKLTELAASLIDERLCKSDFDGAMTILQIIRKHYQVKESSFPQRVEFAYRALERVASGKGFPTVADKLRAENPAAMRVIEMLDAAAARFLVSEMKRVDSAAKRIEIAQLLLRAGAGAGTVLTEEAQKTIIPSEALRLTDVIPYAMTDNMAEIALAGLLRHQTLAVRRRAATILTERAYSRSGTFLLDALNDEKEVPARITLVEGLGHLKTEMAAATLNGIIESRAEVDEVRSAACHAVSLIGKLLSLPVLARTCSRGGRGLTKMLNPVGPVVRSAAARALSVFADHPDAREALALAAEDPDERVRRAAIGVSKSPLLKVFGELVNDALLISGVEEAEHERRMLAGSLKDVSFDQICQHLETSGKSGLLVLNYEGPVGRVFFEEGLVVAIDFEDKKDRDAFPLLAQNEGGYFLFQSGAAAARRSMRESVTKLFADFFREDGLPEHVSG